MFQSYPRLNVRALSSAAPGGASDVHVGQASEMWLPSPVLRDHSTGGIGRRAFEANDGSVVSRINRPIRLLVVAQNSAMRHQMIDYLESHDMRVTSAAERQGALRQLAASEPDLIVLDTPVCQASGLDLLREVRSASNIPLIVADRGQSDASDRVIALELGADDYMTEPLGLRELVARIRAVLRRKESRQFASRREQGRGRLRFGGCELDRHTRRFTSSSGTLVALTKSEYALLSAVLEAPLRPLSRESLLQATRVHEDSFDRSIDVQVLRLRRKLKTDAGLPDLIRTVRGVGYVLAVPVEHM
jgi:two-component system, OmpR family, response regulator